MRCLLLICCAAIAGVPVHAAGFSVYSGASYQAVVAPSSWAVAFGSGIARSTATATLTSDGQWPTTLAGTTVQVNGVPAELYYVSPTQVNFLVPDGKVYGSLPVVITDVASGASQTSTVNVQNTSVAIFTTDGSGSGPGSILNGVTYAAPPFLVETPQNGGSDLRTRLAIFGCGLRYTGNPSHDSSITNVADHVTAIGKDTTGKNYTLVVEYAGAAPGFFGLDQVNIVLPPELDGAGVISLTLSTDTGTSNTVTFQVNSLPASSIRLAGLALSATQIVGGNSLSGTITLNGQARAGGFPVSLRSNIATVVMAQLATVPQGQVSTSFTITTPGVSSVQNVIITAQAGTSTQTASLEIDPANLPQLSGFVVTPASVQGGSAFSATISLSLAAGLGGVNVQLSSDDSSVQPPAQETIPVNNSSVTFAIPTTVVSGVHAANLSATLGTTTLTVPVTVIPAVQLTLSDTTVTAGAAVTATVTLGKPAPTSGATLTVQSGDNATAAVPGTLTIAAGQTTGTFTIATASSISSALTVTITVTYPTVGSQSASLTVNPPSAAQLMSVTLSPSSVTGGTSTTGTITLTTSAPSNGLPVLLKTSNAFIATVPVTVTVPKNATTVNFTVSTFKVAATTAVTITATSGSVSQTAVLTVN